jgi:outer membrane protein assembly factor BamB
MQRISVFLGFILLGFNVVADDWPQWRGPNRDGISAEKGWSAKFPASGPKQLWKANVGVGYGSMSVSNGRVYAMGNTLENEIVSCLDAKTGKEIWKHSYPASSKDPNGYPGPRSTPTVDGNRVYTVGRQGDLFCLDAASGKVIWSKNYQKDYGSKPPTWGFCTSPLVVKEMLIVEPGANGASVVALEKTTGKEIWKAGDDAAGYSSPVLLELKGKQAIAVFAAKDLVIRALDGGAELGRFPWKTSYDVNAATPIVNDSKVFISSGYGTGSALVDFSSGEPKELWRNKTMRNHVNSCVLWKGHLYGFDGQAGRGTLKCLSWETGEQKWEKEGFGTGSVIVADGKLIIYSDKGKLATAEASPDTYKEIASAQVTEVKAELPPNTKGDTWALPVLANGKVYCRSLDELVCVDVNP